MYLLKQHEKHSQRREIYAPVFVWGCDGDKKPEKKLRGKGEELKRSQQGRAARGVTLPQLKAEFRQHLLTLRNGRGCSPLLWQDLLALAGPFPTPHPQTMHIILFSIYIIILYSV